MDEAIQQSLAPKVLSSQQPGDEDSEGQAAYDRPRRYFEAEDQGLDFQRRKHPHTKDCSRDRPPRLVVDHIEPEFDENIVGGR